MVLANSVIVFSAVGTEFDQMLIKAAHQFLRIIADGFVGVDEFIVVVPQERAHLRETMLEMKEHRAATDEWFNVTLDTHGQKLVELRQQLCFATHPFKKWLRFGWRDCFDGLNGELL